MMSVMLLLGIVMASIFLFIRCMTISPRRKNTYNVIDLILLIIFICSTIWLITAVKSRKVDNQSNLTVYNETIDGSTYQFVIIDNGLVLTEDLCHQTIDDKQTILKEHMTRCSCGVDFGDYYIYKVVEKK